MLVFWFIWVFLSTKGFSVLRILSSTMTLPTNSTKAKIRSSYKEVAGNLAEHFLSSLVFDSSTFLLSQIFCNSLIRRPDRSFRGFQCFVLNAFVCTEKFVKGITTNTAQIFVTTGFRISVSNSLMNLPLTLQNICRDEISNCYFF